MIHLFMHGLLLSMLLACGQQTYFTSPTPIKNEEVSSEANTEDTDTADLEEELKNELLKRDQIQQDSLLLDIKKTRQVAQGVCSLAGVLVLAQVGTNVINHNNYKKRVSQDPRLDETSPEFAKVQKELADMFEGTRVNSPMRDADGKTVKETIKAVLDHQNYIHETPARETFLNFLTAGTVGSTGLAFLLSTLGIGAIFFLGTIPAAVIPLIVGGTGFVGFHTWQDLKGSLDRFNPQVLRDLKIAAESMNLQVLEQYRDIIEKTQKQLLEQLEAIKAHSATMPKTHGADIFATKAAKFTEVTQNNLNHLEYLIDGLNRILSENPTIGATYLADHLPEFKKHMKDLDMTSQQLKLRDLAKLMKDMPERFKKASKPPHPIFSRIGGNAEIFQKPGAVGAILNVLSRPGLWAIPAVALCGNRIAHLRDLYARKNQKYPTFKELASSVVLNKDL
jgi:hypothetical protein